MKVKTSITLSKELLDTLSKLFYEEKNRSKLIERIIVEYLQNYKRIERNRMDRDILNKKAGQLNKEAADVLTYQIDL